MGEPFPVVDLVECLNRGRDENGDAVYPDQETMDAVAIGLTDVGDEVILHDLACTHIHNGACSQACVRMGRKASA